MASATRLEVLCNQRVRWCKKRELKVTFIGRGVGIGVLAGLAGECAAYLPTNYLRGASWSRQPATMFGMFARDRSRRLGRNDHCPCGSGRKVKKCCGTEEARRANEEAERRAAEEGERQMHNEMRKIIEAEQERQRRYGKVRPIISARFKDHQFVAVGSRLYYDKKWANFTDFLFFYVKDVMGKEWWLAESAKSPNERHSIVKWHDHLVEMQ